MSISNNEIKESNIKNDSNSAVNNISNNFSDIKESNIKYDDNLNVNNLSNNNSKLKESNIKNDDNLKVNNMQINNNEIKESNVRSEENYLVNYISNNNNEIKESNIKNGDNLQVDNISNNININENINIKNSIFVSQIQLDNPILIQLIEFGYNPLYSKRVIQFLHPRDIEEALDYFSTNNGIIQHRFVQDRNQNNIFCYICGEKKEIHLGYIPENNGINENENENNINNKINNSQISNNIENNNLNNNIEIKNNEIDNNEINIEFNNNEINNNENINNDINNLEINNNENNNKIAESNNTSFIVYKNQLYNSNNIGINEQISPKKIMCPICSDSFSPTKKNTLNNCGHSFCDDCWYDYLFLKIKDNKLTSIKCLNYECEEKLSDKFLIELLKKNKELIKKYKKYKKELDIINDPNKKLCPFPNCDSYLMLKDKNKKVAKCKKNHSFCFLCLEKPHGDLPCKEHLDASMIEFSKNNFIKKCPNCSIITEKSSGCNHITCAKCNYQWCWLCNQKYTEDHYRKGKCKGFQFYKPKNEGDINMAFQGKIRLRASQRQEDVDYPDRIIHVDDFDEISNRPIPRRINNRGGLRNIYYSISDCKKTFLVLLLYILFGHILVSITYVNNRFLRKKIAKIFVLCAYFLLMIANGFMMIYFNLIMLIPYLINLGFYRFIYVCKTADRDFHYAFKQVALKTCIFILYFFFGGFFDILFLDQQIHYNSKNFQDGVEILISIIFLFIYFPIQFIINQIIMIIITIDRCRYRCICRLIPSLENIIYEAIGIRFGLDHD